MNQQISRFLRSEVMGRWQVEPVHLAEIDVTRESLIRFLQDTFAFSRSRATLEIDTLLFELEEKLRCASGSSVLVRQIPAA